MTIAQGTLAFAFLLDLKFTWWEATALLLSFAAQQHGRPPVIDGFIFTWRLRTQRGPA